MHALHITKLRIPPGFGTYFIHLRACMYIPSLMVYTIGMHHLLLLLYKFTYADGTGPWFADPLHKSHQIYLPRARPYDIYANQMMIQLQLQRILFFWMELHNLPQQPSHSLGTSQ